jgi:Contractile injection system tube protein
MTTFPGSPKLIKGALVAYRGDTPPEVIAFQYNPETLSRTLEAQTVSAEGAEAEALRLTGAPVEQIKVEALLDAADQLEKGDPGAVADGIHPQLALLELLIYPESRHVRLNATLLSLGTIEVIPPQGPYLLFVWGKKRVLPVRLTEFSVTEEFHDPDLNPVRAKVSLGLRVLSYNDLPRNHPGYALFMNHQVSKEALAKKSPAGGDVGVDGF